MEQNAILRSGFKLQGYHVLQDLNLFTPEAVRDDTVAIETDDIRP